MSCVDLLPDELDGLVAGARRRDSPPAEPPPSGRAPGFFEVMQRSDLTFGRSTIRTSGTGALADRGGRLFEGLDGERRLFAYVRRQPR